MLKASVLCLAIGLIGLYQLDILDTPGKRESPLRNCLHLIGLESVGAFSRLTIDVGGASLLWVTPS